MIAFPGILAAAAEQAGMKVPPDAENFKPADYPHFHVFCTVQLGAPMPRPDAHWENAKLIASLGPRKIKTVTYQQLLDMGLLVGNSYGF